MNNDNLTETEEAELRAQIAEAQERLASNAQLAEQFEGMLRDMASLLLAENPDEVEFVRDLDLLTDDEIDDALRS